MIMSMAEQHEEALGGPGSVLTRQRRDHVELDRLLHRLAATTGEEQDEVLTQIWRLVFPHAYAEETVLWPALRAIAPDGEQLTLQVEQEHQEINELVTALEKTPHGAPRRTELLERVITLLRQDVRDEEDLLLPRLQQVLTLSQLRRLGLSWELVRRSAPTRPHPVVSRRPPGNVISALPLAVLDRSRDRLDRAARSGSGAAATASAALASIAGAIERLRAAQTGEPAATPAGDTT